MASSTCASSVMYKVKPVNNHAYDTQSMEIPTCMYKMKNFHEDTSSIETNSSGIRELLERQLAILQDLDKLKYEVEEISADFEVKNDISQSKVVSSLQGSPFKNRTVSVKVCPSDPPFCLLMLLKLFEQHGSTCSIVSHQHSSLKQVMIDKIRYMFGNEIDCNYNADLCLRVIWKSDVLSPSLMLSVANQSPILGEASILRYLTTILQPQLYSNLEPRHKATVDAILTACMAEENGSKALVLFVDSCLGKQPWLISTMPTIADIYCSVAIIKSGVIKLPQKVSKWLDLCRKELPDFQTVEELIKSV